MMATSQRARIAKMTAQHFMLLRQATSSSGSSGLSNVEGPVLEEITDMTFDHAEEMAVVLAEKLAQSDAAARVKTLKTVRHAAYRGSRAFRRAMRKADEHLRAAEEGGGADEWGDDETQARTIAKEIRLHLFSDDVLAADESSEPEERPSDRQAMPGMGATGKEGKYDGFGSSPVQRGTILDSLSDMLQKSKLALGGQDDIKLIMDMCLKEDYGDYKPPDLIEYEPGILGVDADEDDEREGFDCMVNRISAKKKQQGEDFKLPDDIFDFAHDRVEDVVSNFCRLSEMAKPTEIEDITNRLSGNQLSSAVAEKLCDHLFFEQSAMSQLRAMLLLESLSRKDFVQLEEMFLPSLNDLVEKSRDERVKMKATKLKLILQQD